MIKWGGRKASSASSSASSSSSPSVPSSNLHASPFSWFSKFKHMRINSSSSDSTTTHANSKKHKPPKQTTSSTVSPPRYSCGNNNKYGGGDDASSSSPWRSSFGEQFEFHDEDNAIESSGFPGSSTSAKKNASREGTLINNNIKLKEKKEKSGCGVIIPKEERKFVDDRKVIKLEMQEHTREEREYENLRSRFEKKAQKVLQEQLLNLERERESSRKLIQEKDLQMHLEESPRPICTPRAHYSFPSSSESKKSSNSLRTSNNKNNIVEKKLMNPTEELNSNLKVKTKKKKQQTLVDGSSRETIHQRRKSKHSPRIRIHSPRMSSPRVDQVCRIKAIEDMKKARLKMKKEREEIVLQETLLPLPKGSSSEDRFAVIKCSLDPRQDFRDSMIEMIIEKRIRNPEEMEELLACYLTLNADEYHDLIIQVFRQVWFQMSHGD
ncbi:hypothetical protein PIB30_041937 [Stylosanthes scabra]|uniref:Transcription repressor n=1 Tax=Stylosanthes scabra TaxID=79078 RepID=A0ABU6SEY1_9FABA|nr:hypothetical protein [Stylosanthes scabra]